MISRIKKLIFESPGIPRPLRAALNGLSRLFFHVESLITEMPPGLVRLMKLQPVAAFASSLVCIFLLKRGFEYVPVAIVSVIFAFFYITFKLYRMKNSNGVLTKLWDAALLFALNNMLLFVLPFYFESMTFPSRNMLFAPVIIGLTVIVNWYYLYQRLIAGRPMRSSLFYALTFFCVLNFLLPILFGMRNIWSLFVSGGVAAIAVLLFVYPHIDLMRNNKNRLVFLSGILLFFVFLWAGRSLIPPSPLKLTSATACREIVDFRPRDPFTSIKIDEITEVYFYSSIFAPRGLSEGIDHVWYHNGRKLFYVELSEIRGGRKEGFGTWSRHVLLEGQGRYKVEVWTAGGQLLGEDEFYVR